ncbi:MAG: hypothetical protein ACK4P3_00995 [Fimbriimonadaceae bacterium]
MKKSLKYLGWLFGLVMVIGLNSNSSAEPPWDVDDPGVTPVGVATMYVAYTLSRLGSETSETLPAIAFTYGLDRRTELAIGTEGLRAAGSGIPTSYSFDVLSLGIKHIVAELEEGPLLAVAYEATLPTRSSRIGTRAIDHAAYLTGHAFGNEARLTWNLGINYTPATGHITPVYGIVVDRVITDRLLLGVQLHGFLAPEPGEKNELAIGFGGYYQFTESLQGQFLIGRSMTGRSDLNLYIGFSADFNTR